MNMCSTRSSASKHAQPALDESTSRFVHPSEGTTADSFFHSSTEGASQRCDSPMSPGGRNRARTDSGRHMPVDMVFKSKVRKGTVMCIEKEDREKYDPCHETETLILCQSEWGCSSLLGAKSQGGRIIHTKTGLSMVVQNTFIHFEDDHLDVKIISRSSSTGTLRKCEL